MLYLQVFSNFGDKLLHHLKTASHVLILLGCRLFSFHRHRRLQPADVTALCPWDGSISLAQASAPHTKHDKLVGGLLSFITWAVISVSADKIAVTKHARLLTALAAQINSRPLPTQVRWSWSNAVERLLHFWPVGAVFELLLLSQTQANCLIWCCGPAACAQTALNWRQMQTWKACLRTYANIHRMSLILVLFCSLAAQALQTSWNPLFLVVMASVHSERSSPDPKASPGQEWDKGPSEEAVQDLAHFARWLVLNKAWQGRKGVLFAENSPVSEWRLSLGNFLRRWLEPSGSWFT